MNFDTQKFHGKSKNYIQKLFRKKNKSFDDLYFISKLLRSDIINQISFSGNGHIGGAMSCVEILISIYFYGIDNLNLIKNKSDKRDRFILSKGHACAALYSLLARLNFYNFNELSKFRNIKGILEGHPEIKIPGIETATGSLGQGISVACGVALGLKHQNINSNIYCVISDGECQEGIVWEQAMFSGFNQLDNLIVFLDYNNLQQDGKVSDLLDISPIQLKWESFNWSVISIDGHSFHELKKAINKSKKIKGKPKLIICKTIKGKGVSFMENSLKWHGTKPPSSNEYDLSLNEIWGLK